MFASNTFGRSSYQSALGTIPASALGLLSMLSDPSSAVRSAALRSLLKCVDTQWHEVAESLPDLEAISEDMMWSEEDRQYAAAIASRVYFHLEEPIHALRLAIVSGKTQHWAVNATRDAYTESLVRAAIQLYVQLRTEGASTSSSVAVSTSTTTSTSKQPKEQQSDMVDIAQLEQVVDAMLERCYADREYTHALGIALESQHADKLQQVLSRSFSCSTDSEIQATLQYALHACVNLVSSKAFRLQALEVLAEEYSTYINSTSFSTTNSPDWSTYCKIYQMLNRPQVVANIIDTLLSNDSKKKELDILMAYQLSFDLVNSGDMGFVNRVASALTVRDEKVLKVLVGGFSGELALSFLHKQSDTDPLIMENLKKSLDEKGGRNSVLHNCAVISHSYMNAGTTNDVFLRDHLDWMKKASNWAKFSATASLGVIHASHTSESMALLEPYLPPSPEENPVIAAGGYAEGGSLYALGLIHGSNAACDSNKRLEACAYLRNHLRRSHANEVISHGAALGVALTAAGSNDLDIVSELKELLYTDSAVAGEAAGIAIGLVLVGAGYSSINPSSDGVPADDSLSELVQELKHYSRDTQHEKIIRGISIGLALMAYRQEEQADATLEEMRSDRDPVIRYGATYGLALAYCGTGSNKAVRILLHTAVSDVSDDVRMAAVIGLAFVLYQTPERVPQLVRLLLESFNPHVRYASCISVGIAMAGTGDPESIHLLEPMMEDMTDYVRQGALLGTSMVYMQQSDTCNGRKIKSFREKMSNMLRDKHQSTLTKMGAILGTGILDAGGRNCSLDFGERNGFTKLNTVVGLVLWLQHWHWFPMMHMLSLALTPTFTIALNKDFKYPKNFEIQCLAKPSIFSYPKRLEEKKEEKKKRVETVMLSTTAKEKARLARRKAKEESLGIEASGSMEVDKAIEEKKETMEMEVDTAAEEPPTSKKKREVEPSSFILKNPSRITKIQLDFISIDVNQRYRPIRGEGKLTGGVILVSDASPEEEEDLGVVKAPYMEDEADPPEPFEWAPPGHPDYINPIVVTDHDKTD